MTSSSPMHDAAAGLIREGQVIAGKYRVERVLGAGGMGVVVAATHLGLDEKVAIKLLLPEATRSQKLAERFLREARAAVKIKSEHVARVTDVGTLESGTPYMVMEYLSGSDLSVVLPAGGPMPVQVAVEYVLQACEALAEAHAAGIVHRDLKPANLFLTRRADGSPCVKVLDFGISKVTTGSSDPRITDTTAVMGSPLYMSPEQLRSSRDVDARTDIWSLGVILYELLTGVPPFDGETMPQLCVAIMQHAPRPIGAIRPDVPAALVAVIDRCLEKAPAQRFRTVGELAEALAPFVTGRARLSAERVSEISRSSGPGPRTELASVSGARVSTSPTQLSTSPSWSGTLPPRKRQLRVALLVAGAGLSLLALGALAFVATRGRDDTIAREAAQVGPAAGGDAAPPATGAAAPPAIGAVGAAATGAGASPVLSVAAPQPTVTPSAVHELAAAPAASSAASIPAPSKPAPSEPAPPPTTKPAPSPTTKPAPSPTTKPAPPPVRKPAPAPAPPATTTPAHPAPAPRPPAPRPDERNLFDDRK